MMEAAAVGVLALQGDFAAHAPACSRRWARPCARSGAAAELDGLAGLVLPGGESTTLLNLMADEPWFDALRAFHAPRRRAPRHLRGRDPARARVRPRPAVASACSTP